METIMQESGTTNRFADFFVELDPRFLLLRKREYLNDLYSFLKDRAIVPDLQRDIDKLLTLFDVAVDNGHSEFVLRYLEEVCFSPEMIPFGAEAYFHTTQVILDWCQKFHSEAADQIMDFRRETLLRLPQKCQSIIAVLNRCLQHHEGDPIRKEKRNAVVQNLILTTHGIELVLFVARWLRFEDRPSFRADVVPGMPNDGYLATQSLPPLWFEHYPFQDDAKMMEIVFLNREDIGNGDLRFSRLAMLGFYLLQSGRVASLDFLVHTFGLNPARTALWEGLFLVDLCVFDRFFQTPEAVKKAATALKAASSELDQPLPIETLVKLHNLGCKNEAKEMYVNHLEAYFNVLPNPFSVARQGVTFCLAVGDVASGLKVVRTTLPRLRGAIDRFCLLYHFFDQILGNVKLEDLILQDLTGLEEAAFIDWAGNKRDDPECSLYLTLYFLRQSKTENARSLFQLNKDKIENSMHKELWNQVEQVLKFIPVPIPQRIVPPEREHVPSSEASFDDQEEEKESIQDLLRNARCALPSYFPQLLKRSSLSTPQLMPAYSDSISFCNICPLQPAENERSLSIPTFTVQDPPMSELDNHFMMVDTVLSDSDDEFFDAMETFDS